MVPLPLCQTILKDGQRNCSLAGKLLGHFCGSFAILATQDDETGFAGQFLDTGRSVFFVSPDGICNVPGFKGLSVSQVEDGCPAVRGQGHALGVEFLVSPAFLFNCVGNEEGQDDQEGPDQEVMVMRKSSEMPDQEGNGHARLPMGDL